jgi:ribosomal protein S5
LIEKTLQERKDELVMLEEFRRRKNLESFREKIYEEERSEGIGTDKDKPRNLNDPYTDIKREAGPPSRFFSPKGDEIYDPSEFTLIFMETDSTTLVTKLNRVNHRRVLVFIGNGNGVISYGKGKGVDYQSAFQNSYIELKKNLIVIDFDHLISLTAPLQTKFNDFRLWLYPRSSPNYWGSMQMYNMLLYTGINHCRFVIKSRKKDLYSMIYAYFELVTKIKKPTQFAEFSGQKYAHVTFNTPLGRSMPYYGQMEYIKSHKPS